MKIGLASLIGFFSLSVTLTAGEGHFPEKVATEIDRLLDLQLKKDNIPASPPATDAEFLRRISLDLNGTIPSASRAREFLESTDPQKRPKLMEELLASPVYGKHFGIIWSNLVTPRNANMIFPPDSKPLTRWFEEHFNENTSWEKLVSDLFTAEGSTVTNPAALFFVLNGDSRGIPQANIMTRNAGQLFLGQQIQCAECHDHPFTHWKQDDFWGMAAFFGRVANKAKDGRGKSEIYESEKTPSKNAGGVTPGKGPTIVIPADSFKNVGKTVAAKFPSGDAPKLEETPYRPAFAAWLSAPTNPFLAPTSVNRMWAHFFGRGFVNPLNDFNEDNPPSHPDILKLLAKEFVDSGFDQKHLIRCITLTKAYQRSSAPLPGNKDNDQAFARMNIKVMTPDVLWDSLCQALEVPDLRAPVTKAPALKKGATKGPALPAPNMISREQFVAFYNSTKDDGTDATDFSHGVPQALLLMNQPIFNEGGKTIERIFKADLKPEQIIESMFIASLSRLPSVQETKDALEFVSQSNAPPVGYRRVYWALINSSEFMLNR